MIARYAIVFFFVMTLVVPSLIINLLCRWLAPKRWWKYYAGAGSVLIWAIVLYGSIVGFTELEVHELTYRSADLPQAFDGYRIVQFSDAHVGTFNGDRAKQLDRIVKAINSQQADLIVFTGDLQNIEPEDVAAHTAVLSRLHAKDGVLSILGNHDYATYQDCSEAQKAKNNQRLQAMERQMGWRLLLNEHYTIRRDSDSLVIAGMENWGKARRMPRRGDVAKTMRGIEPSAFVVMLSHDPSCWREKILPECHAQLTLSGHTHGGQFSLFGWSPAMLSYDEWMGMTYEGQRAIYVSQGVGGLIPFRLGMPGEIAVITLKK